MRANVAVYMIDIAKQLSKSSSGRSGMQRIAAYQEDSDNTNLREALAVPIGKPLSIFDASALPAAYTGFTFGDCVPFLHRDTQVACQHIFDALPSREELEYSLEGDSEPYVAASRSRFDTPEIYAEFASFPRTLRLFRTTKGVWESTLFTMQDRAACCAPTEHAPPPINLPRGAWKAKLPSSFVM